MRELQFSVATYAKLRAKKQGQRGDGPLYIYVSMRKIVKGALYVRKIAKMVNKIAAYVETITQKKMG